MFFILKMMESTCPLFPIRIFDEYNIYVFIDNRPRILVLNFYMISWIKKWNIIWRFWLGYYISFVFSAMKLGSSSQVGGYDIPHIHMHVFNHFLTSLCLLGSSQDIQGITLPIHRLCLKFYLHWYILISSITRGHIKLYFKFVDYRIIFIYYIDGSAYCLLNVNFLEQNKKDYPFFRKLHCHEFLN